MRHPVAPRVRIGTTVVREMFADDLQARTVPDDLGPSLWAAGYKRSRNATLHIGYKHL